MHPKMLPLRAYHPLHLKIRSTNNKTAGRKLHECKECVGVLIKTLTEPADRILLSVLREDSKKCCSYLHLVFLKECQCTERMESLQLSRKLTWVRTAETCWAGNLDPGRREPRYSLGLCIAAEINSIALQWALINQTWNKVDCIF